MYTVLIVFHVLLAVALVAVVLVQRGPGATMGAAFGSGASGTVFGSRGSAGFLTKLTSWIGVAFFAVSLSMAVLVARTGGTGADQELDLGVAGQLLNQPADEQVVTEEEPATEEQGEFLEVPAENDPAGSDEADEEQPPETPELD
ncbi:MAG TPA: preprotein translocase subunit SecG [Wenzhouxiangella sp.]|nr:preprotein translocase subunit SecG [Wenzhouxiangella sp.]